MSSDTETCRSAILSEDVRDFIGNDVRTAFFDRIAGQTLCSQDAGFGYSCLYLPAAAADPITLSRYSYDSIPKCYAPADMQTLNQAGILPVQNYATLQLRGRDVLVGFMDSGIDYTNDIFRNLDGSALWTALPASKQSGTRPCRPVRCRRTSPMAANTLGK